MYNPTFMLNSQKLKRDKIYLSIMEKQSKILKLKLLMDYRYIQHNIEYTKLLNESIELETLQIFKYDSMVEYDINLLTQLMNDMKCDVGELTKEIYKIQKSIIPEYNQFKILNDSINSYINIQNAIAKKSLQIS
jgi:hypothetical protein